MKPKRTQRNLARHDLPQFYLLVALYFVQGIPVGLAFGTVPFLLKSMAKGLSYTSLGLFSMATYPYSLKILWSPVVDSCYSRTVGRRRSWIIPIQLVSGLLLYVLGTCITRGVIFDGVDDAFRGGVVSAEATAAKLSHLDVGSLALYFGILVFLCATQDIAVDGWALTILSRPSLSYASTAQTVGLNMGYFLSFTVFLSLNSAEFANRYVRAADSPLPYGLVSLGGYLRFAGCVYVLVTAYVWLCVGEHPGRARITPTGDANANALLPTVQRKLAETEASYHADEYAYDDEDEETRSVAYIYRCFWRVLQLRPVQTLVCVHLVSKFAFQCNEAATNLKLLEKGFKREDLAVSVLVDVPFELVFGYYVAKWSSGGDGENEAEGNVLAPWLYGYIGRLAAAALGSVAVWLFPADGRVTPVYFALIVVQHLLGSFMGTVQFVGISAFHTRVADPLLGGTYMTLLNTVSNLGGTWPRLPVLWLVNRCTVYRCADGTEVRGSADNCPTSVATSPPVLVRDGYYVANALCVAVGVAVYLWVARPCARRLQRLPVAAWRVRPDKRRE